MTAYVWCLLTVAAPSSCFQYVGFQGMGRAGDASQDDDVAGAEGRAAARNAVSGATRGSRRHGSKAVDESGGSEADAGVDGASDGGNQDPVEDLEDS